VGCSLLSFGDESATLLWIRKPVVSVQTLFHDLRYALRGCARRREWLCWLS